VSRILVTLIPTAPLYWHTLHPGAGYQDSSVLGGLRTTGRPSTPERDYPAFGAATVQTLYDSGCGGGWPGPSTVWRRL
jgi:hypothetical protein